MNANQEKSQETQEQIRGTLQRCVELTESTKAEARANVGKLLRAWETEVRAKWQTEVLSAVEQRLHASDVAWRTELNSQGKLHLNKS